MGNCRLHTYGYVFDSDQQNTNGERNNWGVSNGPSITHECPNKFHKITSILNGVQSIKVWEKKKMMRNFLRFSIVTMIVTRTRVSHWILFGCRAQLRHTDTRRSDNMISPQTIRIKKHKTPQVTFVFPLGKEKLNKTLIFTTEKAVSLQIYTQKFILWPKFQENFNCKQHSMWGNPIRN